MSEPSIDRGSRKIGWLCSFLPEEMILAAGLEPVRIQGRVEAIEQAGGYLSPKICPYVKNLFIRDALRARGLPVLNLEGDMTDERNYSPDQTASSLESFLEIPKERSGNQEGVRGGTRGRADH